MKKTLMPFMLSLCLTMPLNAVITTKTTTTSTIEQKPTNQQIPEAVDLGLSVKWAKWQIGSTKPEKPGLYYAWGETRTKNSRLFNQQNYKYYNKTTKEYSKYYNHKEKTDSLERTMVIGASTVGKPKPNTDYGLAYVGDIGDVPVFVLDSKDDVATVTWGKNWRMPSSIELNELYSKCKWEKSVLNGQEGWKVTGPNGNSIFMPGYEKGERGGGIWSRDGSFYCEEDAYCLSYNSFNPYYHKSKRFYSFTVLPVYVGE